MNKRKAYSMKEKLEIINKVKNGISKASISKDFGIPEGTIRGWIAEESKLNSFVNKLDEDATLNRKKIRLGKHEGVDKFLYQWFIKKRKQGICLTGPDLKARAEKFHKNLNLGGIFKASDGWLWRWRKRHGISQIIPNKEKSKEAGDKPDIHNLLSVYIEEGQYPDNEDYGCNKTTFSHNEQPAKSENIVLDIPTTKEALNALNIVMKWTKFQNNIDNIKLQNLKSLEQDMLYEISESKQTKITDFFK